MSETLINLNGSSTTLYTISYSPVSGNVITFNVASGVFILSDSSIPSPITKPFIVKFTQNNTNITIRNTTINREMRFDFNTAVNSVLTLDNITSRSDLAELYNIYCESYHASNNVINITNSSFYATPTNTVIKRTRTAAGVFQNNNIYINLSGSYIFGTVDAFVSPIRDMSYFNILIGSEVENINIALMCDEDDIILPLTLQVIESLTISETSFNSDLNLKVKTGKTLSFNNCSFHTRPTFINFSGYSDGVGNINFNLDTNSFFPSVLQLSNNTMINLESSPGTTTPTYNNITGAVRLNALASAYTNYAIYNNVAFIRDSTIYVTTAGDWKLGTALNKLNFDLKVLLNADVSSLFEVYNDGNVIYTNNTSNNNITWKGEIFSTGGEPSAFYTTSRVYFTELKLYAAGGNNILNKPAIYGNFVDCEFGYYPSNNVYNLDLEHLSVLDKTLNLLAKSDTPYKFTSLESYIPKLAVSGSVDQSNIVTIQDSSFYNGITLTLPIAYDANINSSSFYTQNANMIDLQQNHGTLVLNSLNTNSGMNRFHYLNENQSIFKDIDLTTDTEVISNGNYYNLVESSYNYLTAEIGKDKTLLSTGVVELSGSYFFSLTDETRLTIKLLENTIIENSNLKQGFTLLTSYDYDILLKDTTFNIDNAHSYDYSDFINVVDPSMSLNLFMMSCDYYVPSIKTNNVLTQRKTINNYIYDSARVLDVRLILTGQDYLISEPADAFMYDHGHVYTPYADRDISININVDNTLNSVSSNKNLTINCGGPLNQQIDRTLTLSGTYGALGLNIDSSSCKFINLTNVNILPNGAPYSLLLNDATTSGEIMTHDITLDTTTIRPSNDAYILITRGNSINLETQDVSFSTSLDVSANYGIFSLNSGSINLNNVLITSKYNKVYWPVLPLLNLESYTFSSQQLYFAESWSPNDPIILENYDSGLAKPASFVNSAPWAANSGYHNIPLRALYGGGDTSFNVSLSLSDTTYAAGSLYDTETVGLITTSFGNDFYLRFNSDNHNLLINDISVTGTFTPRVGYTWGSSSPVSLLYTINNNINVQSYTLYAQVNMGEFQDVTVDNVALSDSRATIAQELRFIYRNENNDNLKFLKETYVGFPLNLNYVVAEGNVDINNYVLIWPAAASKSETLSLRPSPDNSSWTSRELLSVHFDNSFDSIYDREEFYSTPELFDRYELSRVNVRLNNIDIDNLLLIDTRSAMSNLSIITDNINNAILDTVNNRYAFNYNFYLMSHILPFENNAFVSLPLTTTAQLYINDVLYSANITATLNVEEGGAVISEADVAQYSTLSISFQNISQFTASDMIRLDVLIADGRSGVQTLTGATARFNVLIPLDFYINAADLITDATLAIDVVKGIETNLYVFSSSKYSNVEDYNIDISLTSPNEIISISAPLLLQAGQTRSFYNITIPEDDKIYGNSTLDFITSETFINSISFNYTERQSHNIKVKFARAILNGYENANGLISQTLNIAPQLIERNVMIPSNWSLEQTITIDANSIDYRPVTKYTFYKVTLELGSLAFSETDINSLIDLTVQVKLFDGITEISTDMFIINDDLSNSTNIENGEISVTDLIRLNNPMKKVFFRLKEAYNGGSIVTIKLVFGNKAGSNYKNLSNEYVIANIDYSAIGLQVNPATASLYLNTWRIGPSTDGKFIRFYHNDFQDFIFQFDLSGQLIPRS